MADIVRPLGDVFPPFDEGEGVGVVDTSDLQAYVDANNNNNARTIITFDTTTTEKVLNDVTNGGFVGNQAKVASVHETGFVSDLDRVLMKQYLEASPKPNTIREFINQLDTAEIIPPVDPSVDTLEELREDVTTHILDLKVHQADVMLKAEDIAAKSLNDMREKTERLWGEAFRMDYDTIAHLDASMNAGIEHENTYDDDSGYLLTPPEILSSITNIIMTRLDKSQLEEVRDKYWTPTAITFSDPPTDEERDRLRRRIWSIPVASGVDFYDNYRNAEGHGGGGGDDPSESLVPADPTSAPLASGNLLTFINSCQSGYQSMFTNTINTTHPNQIITVKGTSGSDAVVSCYEVSNGAWVAVSGLSDIPAKVGQYGIHPINEIHENTYSNRTPAGAWRLGNWSTSTDDVGAFGKDARSGIKINYKQLTATMHWIDAGRSPETQVDAYPSWYNTFIDTAENPYHLIQWKRADWETGTFFNKDGSKTYAGKDTPFEYGKYYANFAGVASNASEHLWDWVNTSYRNAIVIRFNMPPHVQKPITPSDGTGSGSAYFLHSFNNDSTPGYTGGCVSVHNDKMVAILNWIDRTKSPYIFIGL
jgi:L,D-peptidoglycan transpeptidase YkuD (ErfK/YbiS/YcfS/YnhG family)